MGLEIICGIIVLIFSTILAMAGMGAAKLYVPIFFWLGIPLEVAIPTALLANGVGLTAASIMNAKHRLIPFRLALPIALVALTVAPLGAYSSQFVPRRLLLALFAGFLVFAGSMILFYVPREGKKAEEKGKDLMAGIGLGTLAGYVAGLLGVGGGGLISPILIYLGHKPRKVAATTAFVVPFSSFAGFSAYLAMGHAQPKLMLTTGSAAIVGALVGTWLKNEKMKSIQVKRIIGIIILTVAAKIFYGLACTM